MKNLNLTKLRHIRRKSPYEIYQEWEEIPVHKGFHRRRIC